MKSLMRLLTGAMALTLLAGGALSVGCSGDDPCVEGTYTCDGNTLQRCVNGEVTTIQDCGMDTCHAEMGHCHHDDHKGGHGHGGDNHKGGHHMGGSHMGGSHMGGHHMGGAGGK